MKQPTGRWLLVLLAILGACSFLYAQGTMDPSKGQVGVEVQDSSGAVVQNAKVTLSGPTGAQKAASDIRGHVVFYNLIPGAYTVKVELEGFRTHETQNVTVVASQRSLVRAQLAPGAVSETVQVTDAATRVDTSSTTTGATITDTAVMNLPVARNVASLMTMAPGVADGGGTGASNPSISGASGLENMYVIDGVNATDSGYGSFGIYNSNFGAMGSGVNFDFVKEVQVKSGGFEAQYGQALGGIVNIVTHSGTNEFHGALYMYGAPRWAEGTYRQENDARTTSFNSETHGRRAFDFGVNMGGPALKDRLFWYGSFNPSFSTRYRMAPKEYAVRALGELPRNTRSYNWVGKVNFEINSNHHLEGTGFGDPSRNTLGWLRSLVRNDTTENSISSLLFGTRNWAVKYNGLLDPKTVVSGVFSWNHGYFYETPGPLANQPMVIEAATNARGGGLGFLQDNDSENKQWSFMVTRNLDFLGGHQIDAGYAYNPVEYSTVNRYSGGDWALPAVNGVPSDLVGRMVHGVVWAHYRNRSIGGVVYPDAYRVYRGNYSDPFVTTTTAYHSAFVQDAWQINKYFTAKLGLRWEEQKLQGNLTTYSFTGNWAPRLGFIIDPTGKRRTKIFANWGKYFEKVPQDMAIRAMSGEQSLLNGYFTQPNPTAANFIPGSKFTSLNPSATVIAAGTKTGYQEEIVAGVEHELPGGVVLSGRFIHRSLKRILEDISGVNSEAALAGAPQNAAVANPSATLDLFQNPLPCSAAPSLPCNPDYTYHDDITGIDYGPFLAASGEYAPDGIPDTYPDPRRVYKSFELRAERRFANNWSLMASYRLAKLFGNYEGFFRNDNGQADPGITSLFDFMWSPMLSDQFKVGVMPTDRRHIANAYFSYLFKKRFNLGLGWNIQSGSPISKLGAHPAYGNSGEVPIGGRGAFGRTATQHYTDVKLSYFIPFGDVKKLRFSADLFNIFNQKTITEVDMDYEIVAGSLNEDFLRPYTIHRPFYSQFAVRFEF